MKVFVVIPAYNEAEKIGPVVRDIFSLYPDFNIVVVDDGSSDKTSQVSSSSGVTVLRHELNRGQGAALETGNSYSLLKGAEAIIHFDADGQFDPREIGKLLQPVIQGKVEIVLGSRFLGQQESNIPWSKKYFILPIARVVNFLFTGLWLSDAHNGFRVLSRRAAKTMPIKQDRMAHASEILAQIKNKKISFKEMPVTVYYDHYGQKFGGGLKIIRDLIIQNFF